LRLPLVGPVLRRNLIARWCDALRIGISAGMDLPAALTLAGEIVASPALIRDGQELVALLDSGQRFDAAPARKSRLLPTTVPAALQLAADHNTLPQTLESLSQLYQNQAELRMSTLP